MLSVQEGSGRASSLNIMLSLARECFRLIMDKGTYRRFVSFKTGLLDVLQNDPQYVIEFT
jgi:hypothetical protein